MDIYSAIHKAADHIEAHPDELRFAEMRVGRPGCATCYVGHIGRVMGYPETAAVYDVSDQVFGGPYFTVLDDICHEIGYGLWTQDYRLGVKILRLYAERYHAPAAPDWNALATPDDNIREVTA